jgi:predicted HicB family RNase H-like nuclease
MMDWLLGFAHVAALKDQETTDQWTETVGQHMACYNGAIRIYWPGWRPDNPSINHKLYLPWYLPTDHAEAPKLIFGLLARVSSFRLMEGETVSKVQSLFQQKEKDKSEKLKKQLEIYKKKAVQTDNKEQEQFLEAFEKTLQENDLIKEENKSLKEELATAKDNLEALCRSSGTESINAEDCGMPVEPREFLTVLEAAKAASQDFSGNLHFLNTSFASAANSPFARPEEVYQHFKALNDLVAEWREKEGKLGRGWKDWFDEHGIADYKAQISQTTKGKYGDEYKFIYKGERKFFEPHFTLGSGDPNRCLSIHWYQDDDDLTVIIGHCGKHLRNTLS